MFCLFAWIVLAALVIENSAVYKECVVNEDCATDRVCADNWCKDPCKPVTEVQTQCYVINHVVILYCTKGHTGNPLLAVTSNRGCSIHPALSYSDCKSHDQCPSSKVCIKGSCADPCDGLCGGNTTCTVRQHIPACACKQGHLGDPFVGCSLQVAPATWPAIPHGKKRFYVENSKTADWHGAYMNCVWNNSRLVSVESMEEMEDIRREIRLTGKRLGNFWTSGSDYGNEGHFVWTTTGNQLSSTSELWLPAQPDNAGGSENCVQVWERFEHQGYGLNDGPCNISLNYICEF